jgi:hypothetical protein
VQLFSANGNLVLKSENEGNFIRIPTSNFATGMYLTRLLIDGKFYTRKVIVQ